ncbi:MAG TPA: SDR family oxidoreductase [Polyangiaceae bacterium]
MKQLSIVTGASAGIGFEMAKSLAGLSHDLLLVSRDEGKLQRAAARIRELHPAVTIHTLAVDLATPDAAQRVFEWTEALGVEVDVLINNAGVGVYGEHVELERTALSRMFQLNVTSLCELCLLYGQQMKARGRGRILNVASTAAYQPTPFFAAYGASKAFVLNFSEGLAKELEDFGVTVSCVSPGPTDTAFFADLDGRGISNDHFEKGTRDQASDVARIGIETLFSGRLSRVVGTKNFWLTSMNRFAPRSVVARFAKGLMRASSVPESRPQLTGQ